MRDASHTAGPPLVGEQVTLRDWRAADIPVWREWMLPHQDWHRWDGPYFPKRTVEEVEAAAAEKAAAISDQPSTPRQSLVIADRADDQLLGAVNWHWESEASNWRRIGITVYDPAVRGRGIGTEALQLWSTHLFTTCPIVRLDLSTWSGNVAMCEAAAKAGWVEEARFRDAREVRGRRYDSVVYGTTRGEWDARRR
ncbi:MAG: GNAT family N-acetyltransferase [Nocardioidaceae bacterium]